MTIRPALSVIVPTYQGAQRIMNTLGSLEKQSFRDFEVIVVIDGSTDDTKTRVQQASFRFPLLVHEQPNKGRAGARNAGAALAQAHALIFLDDDLTFDDSLLKKYEALAEQGHPIAVGSAYAVPVKERDEFFHFAEYLNTKWESGLAKATREVLKKPYLNAQNCLIRRDVFELLGGFDDRLRDAEDFALAVAAFEKKIPILLDAEIRVGHHLQPDFKTYARRLVEYQNARQALAQLMPAANHYMTTQVQRSRAKTIFYKMVSAQAWIDLVDKGLFMILPRALRFRIYDLLLTAYSVTRVVT
ncbi:glycosyltransferase family 2 protein [Chryseolinea soli]|uniref:Glycosyltransferase family 2 protein n=1 Tax=Chryseolinea soli TaxID=2321403 RepID=A0A385SLH5_9BACT|nr:glycosyltransferase family 2 protein [Chryseolinea soli]AYB31326.1 glycosyltransferase family 2 protein [Chryseolinea soli]